METAPALKTDGRATASMVLGIMGLLTCCFGPLTAIPAIILGHIALSAIRKAPGLLQGSGMAIAGLVTGYLSVGLMIILIPLYTAIALPAFVAARDTAQTAVCVHNMRLIELAKEQTALEKNLSGTAAIPEDDLCLYLKDGKVPTCPKKGIYTVGPIGTEPSCSVHGTLSQAAEKQLQRRSSSIRRRAGRAPEH